jgi:hypothetical protein
VVCVLDEAGQIHLEQRVRTNAKALCEVFGAMARSRIALETGMHSPWVILAHAGGSASLSQEPRRGLLILLLLAISAAAPVVQRVPTS